MSSAAPWNSLTCPKVSVAICTFPRSGSVLAPADRIEPLQSTSMLRILRSEFVHILRSPRCSDSVGFLSDVCHVDNVVGRRAPDPNRPWGKAAEQIAEI